MSEKAYTKEDLQAELTKVDFHKLPTKATELGVTIDKKRGGKKADIIEEIVEKWWAQADDVEVQDEPDTTVPAEQYASNEEVEEEVQVEKSKVVRIGELEAMVARYTLLLKQPKSEAHRKQLLGNKNKAIAKLDKLRK